MTGDNRLKLRNMKQTNQGNDLNSSSSVAKTRKRGRPRKYSREEHTPSGNLPRQVDPNDYENNIVVGQTGTTTIGNTRTTLTGVVFKPGHYVPVRADNDVALDIQMIRRNEIRNRSHANSQRDVNNRLATLKSSQPTSGEVIEKDTARKTGFNNLLTEVLKRVKAPSQSENSESTDDSTEYEDRALSIEPLQVVQPQDNRYPASMSQHLESYQTGNMTECLSQKLERY